MSKTTDVLAPFGRRSKNGIHVVRWRFVLVGFVILAVAISYAFHVNDQQTAQIQDTGHQIDLKFCESGNDFRQTLDDMLRYIADHLDNPAQARAFVEDVITQKLQTKNCPQFVKPRK